MKAFLTAILIGLTLDSAFPAARADAVKPDPRALTLLQKEAAAVQAINSLTADYQVTYRFPHSNSPAHLLRSTVTITLMRPNYANFSLFNSFKSPKTGNKWSSPSRSLTDISDGKTLTRLSSNDTFVKEPAQATGDNIFIGGFVEPLNGFFSPKSSFAAEVASQQGDAQLKSLRYLGRETWDGTMYQVVEWRHVDPYITGDMAKGAPGGVVIETQTMDIGADGLIHRMTERNNIGWDIDETLQDVRINPKLTQADFALKLPADAHAEAPPPPLLADGTQAPDFTVQGTDGKPVKLSDYQGKVVVLDFWATWCGPCQASLPHTNAVAAQFQDKNVVVLAVNTSDTLKAFQAWLPQHKSDDALTFAIDTAPSDKNIATTLYHVSGIPTQYIIAPDGKIVKSLVGYGGPTDDLADAIREALPAMPQAKS